MQLRVVADRLAPFGIKVAVTTRLVIGYKFLLPVIEIWLFAKNSWF